ncbi:hypothetical protein GCM10017744_073510 [Streptomyces antimycoticus]
MNRQVSEGPGLTAVRLETADGVICLDRANGSLAELAMPGQPDRHVALQRREVSELIAEELRRLDPDEIYASSVKFGVNKLGKGGVGTLERDAKAAPATQVAPGSDRPPLPTRDPEAPPEHAPGSPKNPPQAPAQPPAPKPHPPAKAQERKADGKADK